MGVKVVEKPFVTHGKVATAAGCLAGQYLAGWVIESLLGTTARQQALLSVQPVGEGMAFSDEELLRAIYAPTAFAASPTLR